MYRFIILLIAVLFSTARLLHAETGPLHVKPLGPKSHVAIYTCDPGPELYATFGHSAIGIIDPDQKLMLIFNYGTFDFNVPHFYLKFASGKLLYRLSVGNYWRFVVEYEAEERRVIEQQLEMTLAQRQRLFDLLVENYKPENREYQYDFFFDNCATRILDMLYLTLGDTLVYQAPVNAQQPTFRDLISPYLSKSKWSEFGIDIALGSVIDKPATPRQQSFLPDYLKVYFDNCTINGQAFVKSEKVLVPPSKGWPLLPVWASPVYICWFLMVLVLIISIILRRKNWAFADRLIFSTFGLIGIFILLLWFATDHDATAANLNILWANPLFILYAFQVGKPLTRYSRILYYGLFALTSLVLVAWWWIPQEFNPAFYPLIWITIIRLAMKYQFYTDQKTM